MQPDPALPSTIIVPDPSYKLISLAIFSLLACQHRSAEVRKQVELLVQPGGVKQGSILHRFHITVNLVRDYSHLMIQFTGLFIFAPRRQ